MSSCLTHKHTHTDSAVQLQHLQPALINTHSTDSSLLPWRPPTCCRRRLRVLGLQKCCGSFFFLLSVSVPAALLGAQTRTDSGTQNNMTLCSNSVLHPRTIGWNQLQEFIVPSCSIQIKSLLIISSLLHSPSVLLFSHKGLIVKNGCPC